MKQFYNNLGFIIGFVCLTIFAELAFGSKFATKFLSLVLFSMVILNYEKVINFVENKTRLSE